MPREQEKGAEERSERGHRQWEWEKEEAGRGTGRG